MLQATERQDMSHDECFPPREGVLHTWTDELYTAQSASSVCTM